MCFTSFKNIFFQYLPQANKYAYIDLRSQKISIEIHLRSRYRFTKDLGKDSLKISIQDLKARSFEDLDARDGMNRAPRSSRDLVARSFENQLMGFR